jgi:hypothetical protein
MTFSWARFDSSLFFSFSGYCAEPCPLDCGPGDKTIPGPCVEYWDGSPPSSDTTTTTNRGWPAATTTPTHWWPTTTGGSSNNGGSSTTGGSDSSSSGYDAAVAVAVTATVLLVLGVLAAVLFLLHRRRRGAAGNPAREARLAEEARGEKEKKDGERGRQEEKDKAKATGEDIVTSNYFCIITPVSNSKHVELVIAVIRTRFRDLKGQWCM